MTSTAELRALITTSGGDAAAQDLRDIVAAMKELGSVEDQVAKVSKTLAANLAKIETSAKGAAKAAQDFQAAIGSSGTASDKAARSARAAGAEIQLAGQKAKQAGRDAKDAGAGFGDLEASVSPLLGKLAQFLGPAGLAAAGALTVKSIFDTTNAVAQQAKALENAAATIGISVEKLGGLQHAFAQSGIEATEVNAVLAKLTGKMSQAAAGSQEVATVFDKLGIKVVDAAGNLRNVGDVVDEMSDAFARMGPGPERTAMALKLFEETGPKFVSTLGRGSQALRELTEAGVQSGAVLSQDTARAFKELGVESVQLDQNLQGIKNTVAEFFLPTVQSLTGYLNDAAGAFLDLSGKGLAWDAVLQGLIDHSAILSGLGLEVLSDEQLDRSDANVKRLRGEIEKTAEILRDLKDTMRAQEEAGQIDFVAISADRVATWTAKLHELQDQLRRYLGVAPEVQRSTVDVGVAIEGAAASTKRLADETERYARGRDVVNRVLAEYRQRTADFAAPDTFDESLGGVSAPLVNATEANKEYVNSELENIKTLVNGTTSVIGAAYDVAASSGNENVKRAAGTIKTLQGVISAFGTVAIILAEVAAQRQAAARRTAISETATLATLETTRAVGATIATEGSAAISGAAAFGVAAGIITAVLGGIGAVIGGIASRTPQADRGYIQDPRLARFFAGREDTMVAMRRTETILNERQTKRIGDLVSQQGQGGVQTVVVPIHLDGREVGRAVLRQNRDGIWAITQDGINRGKVNFGSATAGQFTGA